MPQLPPHPESQDDPGDRPERPPGGGRSRLVWAVGITIVVLAMVVLHLTGTVGAGSH